MPRARATPFGSWDINILLNRLPEPFDLFLVKADAFLASLPRNLASLKCPKVLIIGDTQHMKTPLHSMIAYARSEPFDLIVTDHGRRNLHIFHEVGELNNLYWLPSLNLNIYPTSPRQHVHKLSFVGQVGQWHPVRKKLWKAVLEAGLPLTMFSIPQKEAAEIYASSQISLNCSLNGDLNLRVFEVLAHGGFLLTDSLRAQAGMEDLFVIGSDFDVYRDRRDLINKIHYYLAHPEVCAKIAAQGQCRFLEMHHPRYRRRQLLDLAFGGTCDPLFHVTADPRATFLPPLKEAKNNHIVDLYETFQQLNCDNEIVRVLIWPRSFFSSDSMDCRLISLESHLDRTATGNDSRAH